MRACTVHVKEVNGHYLGQLILFSSTHSLVSCMCELLCVCVCVCSEVCLHFSHLFVPLPSGEHPSCPHYQCLPALRERGPVFGTCTLCSSACVNGLITQLLLF